MTPRVYDHSIQCVSKTIVLFIVLFFSVLLNNTTAQVYKQSKWEKTYAKKYDVAANEVYKRVGVDSVMLDIYSLKDKSQLRPLLIFFHGGGWVKGSKDSSSQFTPYLNNDWAVINAEYRFLQVAQMPAPAEDARCVLAWAYENASKYGIDTNKIVISGTSAGGHLALISGMVPPNSELDKSCSGSHIMRPAAIVDFYGPTDFAAFFEIPARKNQVKKFFHDVDKAKQIGALISPINYVRKDLPPIIMIQGDEDPTVPYSQSTSLKAALDKVGARSYLYTVSKGQHGKFSKDEMSDIYKKVSEFLKNEAGLDFQVK